MHAKSVKPHCIENVKMCCVMAPRCSRRLLPVKGEGCRGSREAFWRSSVLESQPLSTRPERKGKASHRYEVLHFTEYFSQSPHAARHSASSRDLCGRDKPVAAIARVLLPCPISKSIGGKIPSHLVHGLKTWHPCPARARLTAPSATHLPRLFAISLLLQP